MKTKYLLVLVLLSNLTIINAQYSSIFGESYTEWNYMTLYCDAIITETYVQETEEEIDGILYKQINEFGLLRASDDQAKLWYRNFEGEEEILIMDLTLQVGDIFEVGGQELVVELVYEENNLQIVQFDFVPFHCGTYESLRFVEGLVPNLGFQFMLTPDTDNQGW